MIRQIGVLEVGRGKDASMPEAPHETQLKGLARLGRHVDSQRALQDPQRGCDGSVKTRGAAVERQLCPVETRGGAEISLEIYEPRRAKKRVIGGVGCEVNELVGWRKPPYWAPVEHAFHRSRAHSQVIEGMTAKAGEKPEVHLDEPLLARPRDMVMLLGNVGETKVRLF